MGDTPRWVLVVIVLVIVVGLIAFARGREHRRGDELGAHGTPAVTVERIS